MGLECFVDKLSLILDAETNGVCFPPRATGTTATDADDMRMSVCFYAVLLVCSLR